MTKIESEHIRIKGDISKIYDFVRDLNHFHQLLPQDRISEWNSDRDNCSFKVQNTATIDLHFKEEIKNKSIHLASGNRSPFPFTLDILFTEEGNEVVAWNVFKGELNPLLKMMAEQALKNLFNHIANQVGKINFSA